jgi:hypothetical protein
MHYCNDTRERLAFVAASVGVNDPNDFATETYPNPGWSGGPVLHCGEDWTVAKLADELDQEVERYLVLHAWRTDYHGGSQLTFWCRYCKDHHVHGRHHGPGRYANDNNDVVSLVDTSSTLAKQVRRLWRKYVRAFEGCTYNPDVPGGRGTCTCPMGSGDGHRVAHCWKPDSGYYDHGYILHEVAPNDARALVKPKRVRKS